MPNDENVKGEINTKLRCSDVVPRQRCQNLSAEQRTENWKKQKLNMLNEKKKTYDDMKTKTEFLIESSNDAEIKIASLVLGKKWASKHMHWQIMQNHKHFGLENKTCMQNRSQLFANRAVQRFNCEST